MNRSSAMARLYDLLTNPAYELVSHLSDRKYILTLGAPQFRMSSWSGLHPETMSWKWFGCTDLFYDKCIPHPRCHRCLELLLTISGNSS